MADESIEDRLRKLPFRSIVAFAARYAKRMQPLYQDATSIPDFEDHEAAVNDAIMLAESFAGGTNFAQNYFTRHYSRACRAASLRGFYRAGHAARMAYFAVLAIRRANNDMKGLNSHDDCDCAAYAAYASEPAKGSAYAECAYADCASIAAADLGTLEMLAAMRPAQMPTDQLGDTVDTSDFGPLGPLWPDGPPKSLTATSHKKMAVEEIPLNGGDFQIAGWIGDECDREEDDATP